VYCGERGGEEGVLKRFKILRLFLYKEIPFELR